jgi:hypothetical protein
MTRGIKRHRRRGSYVVLLVAFAALGIWASYALAGNDKGQVTVNVEYHNDDCGGTQGKRVIGTDVLKRSGDTLSVTHTVHGADPGNYDLFLYDVADCQSYVAYLGKFKVDGSGDGGRSSSADVSGTTGQFFVCDFNRDTETYDCSLTGKLGKNQGVTTVTVTT